MYTGSENSDLSYFETASQCAAGENQSHDILTEAFDRSNKKINQILAVFMTEKQTQLNRL